MTDVLRWRKRRRLTQVEAASLLGVSQPYLSLLEEAARPITAAHRARLKTTWRDRACSPAMCSFRETSGSLAPP